MKIKIALLNGVLAIASAVWGAASSEKNGGTSVPAIRASATADAMRVEGERRFRSNCGRCHAAPQKFPPRMMGTIVRHMRVRATITDEDMKLVLYYMTQ
jgi:mono/diheme cytochrome c family protein